jgi:parvulin-like peptidyl-prolyl isomerase
VASACLSLLFLPDVYAGDEAPSVQKSSSGEVLYARVGDREITVDQYNQTYQRAVRQRFYHSKPPEAELNTVRQEIADELITRELLLIEAQRTGMQPDQQNIEATLSQYDERYASSPRWQQERASLLGALKVKLEEDDLLKQMESKVRNIPPPDEKQLKTYYEQNLDKFTEPMRMKLSLILLVVDPSSSSEVWQAAMDSGNELLRQLDEGADFAELARSYSGDVSAEQGGDMGYVHREMLSETVQESIDGLEPGQISEAIRTLQGVAILRLDERQPERVREFEDVRERALNLWLREHSERAWSEFKQKLRDDTPVTVFVDVVNSGNDV